MKGSGGLAAKQRTVRYQALAGPGAGELFHGMTFPAYRHLLTFEPSILHLAEGDRRLVHPIAVGAVLGDRAVGLILGCLPARGGQPAELLSLYTSPAWRRKGIARGLLRTMQRGLAGTGARRLQAVYMTGRPGADAFEDLARSEGWDEPQPRMLSVRCTAGELAATRWFDRYPLREDFELFPWAEIGDGEYRALKESHAATEWIAEDLLPWRYDGRGFDAVSSLGVRHGGQVVGWVINHELPNGTLRFTCAYLRDDLKRRGRLVPVFTESIRRLAPDRRCSFTTPVHHQEMVAWVRRHCAPHLTYVGETVGTSKQLG